MDEATLIRTVITVFGITGTLAVTLLAIVLRRLYKSVDVLFSLDKERNGRIRVLEFVALKDDPESTALFKAIAHAGGND